MNSILNVGFVQYDIKWEDAEANRALIDSIVSSAETSNLDLLLLPEMFSTGFSMNTKAISESMQGDTVKWMKALAQRIQSIIAGSVIIEENGNTYNRLLWVSPEGTVDYYDKRHLFTLAKEHHHFTAGSEKKIFQIQTDKGETWEICPMICYDVRFPVWSRNTSDYDVLLYVANFPEKRNFAWTQLLIARAIENQTYLLGVNRIGNDANQISYIGNSVALNFDGRELLNAGNAEGLFSVSFDKNKLTVFRRAYQFHKDKDQFTIL